VAAVSSAVCSIYVLPTPGGPAISLSGGAAFLLTTDFVVSEVPGGGGLAPGAASKELSA
jgi:hypothetical protein